MPKIILAAVAALLSLTGGWARADAPHQVGGFVLGTDIADCKDILKLGSGMPIRYQEYLHQVEIRPLEGFKSGLIAYGNCHAPGRIVQIKLKYGDGSRKFYDQLLKRFKRRFGEPTEWRGDAFHVVIAWKWSFVDQDNNAISLTLQHNIKDEEEKMGNSVKMTMWNLIEDERRCYRQKRPDAVDGGSSEMPRKAGKTDWDVLVPR